jgi:hypothetical protein
MTSKTKRYIVGGRVGKKDEDTVKIQCATYAKAKVCLANLKRRRVRPNTVYIYDTVAKQIVHLQRLEERGGPDA